MYKPIYKPVKFKLKPMKLKPIKFNIDSDKDGVPDWRDCKPFNPKKQGWWHDIKQAVTGGTESQELTQDIENFEQNPETGEYILPKKKKKYGQEGYTTEGLQELGQDVGKAATYVGGKVKGGAKYVGQKVGTKLDEWAEKATRPPEELIGEGQSLGRATKNAGVRQARQNIKEGLMLKSPSGGVRVIRVAGPAGTPPASSGWWGSRYYNRPRLPRPPGMNTELDTSFPEEYLPAEGRELAVQEEYSSVKIPYDMKRSPYYQEQSSLGPGVVPYRPVSAQQAMLKVPPIGAVTSSRDVSSRPPGLIPIVEFRNVKFTKLYFGRKVRP